jgi:HD superfamily phosphohydrolase
VFPGSKDRVFRDPVHGLIEFRGARRPLADLLDTRALQRLRLIRQMGWAPMVYPGAEHSRFGHALGAYHVATRVVDQLRLEPEVGRHVLVAAMLHDIGHGPFSHAWEHVFGGSDHEAWGGRIVAEDDELASALEALEPGLGATLARFWGKTYRPHFARKLVSSQLDVDRLDYLLRDGHYSGAGYATYDLDWIIHALQIERVRDGDDDPADLVVDYRRGMYAVEQYLFARSYMYAQVYHHKTVRAAEWLFIKTMERFAALARTGDEPPGLEIAARMARGGPVSVTDFLALHDAKLVAALERWAGLDGPAAEDPVLRDLATRLVRRRLFKTLELGDDPRVAERLAPQALDIAERHFGAAGRYYVQVDTAQQSGAGGGDELHVVDHPRYGTVTLSRLLQDMPIGHPMAAVRLIAAPELLGELRPLADAALPRPRGRR